MPRRIPTPEPGPGPGGGGVRGRSEATALCRRKRERYQRPIPGTLECASQGADPPAAGLLSDGVLQGAPARQRELGIGVARDGAADFERAPLMMPGIITAATGGTTRVHIRLATRFRLE